MAQQELLGRFLVGLANNEISVNVTVGLHELGKAFQLNWQICLLSLVLKRCHRLLVLLKENHQISGIG